MPDILVGIAVGTIVAIIGQLIAFFFGLVKRKESENRKAKAVIRMMFLELKGHQYHYERLFLWVNESIEKDGEQHTKYSYQPVATEAYENVFLPNWYMLPTEVVEAISEYYSTIKPLNILSGSFATPTPVPIAQVKFFLENAQKKASEIEPILERLSKK